MPLSKADIDELVEGLPQNSASHGRVYVGGFDPNASHVKRDLYLAAGLTATGEPKPEKVRCWMVRYPDGGYRFIPNEPDPISSLQYIPGTFVPDGAE